MDSAAPYLPPLPFTALRRYYLRQEPGALIAHAGICAGGAGQPAFLPRHTRQVITDPDGLEAAERAILQATDKLAALMDGP